MAYPNLSNGWTTTLTGSLTNVATTVDVASTSGIPARPFVAVIRAEGANTDEIVSVTGLTGSTITISRAAEAIADGTSSASAHASGATISHILTKQALVDATTYATGVKWTTGTSMPGSPSTNDRVTRTDLGMDFYYDGTRWLSVQEFIHPIPNGDSAFPAWPLTANGNPGRSTLLSSDWQIYIVKYYANTYVSTTNSGTAYWTVNLIADPGGSTIATFNTSADSPDTHTGHAVSVNTALTTSFRTVTVQAIKTSTPGNLYAPSAMLYRLVGV